MPSITVYPPATGVTLFVCESAPAGHQAVRMQLDRAGYAVELPVQKRRTGHGELQITARQPLAGRGRQMFNLAFHQVPDKPDAPVCWLQPPFQQ